MGIITTQAIKKHSLLENITLYIDYNQGVIYSPAARAAGVFTTFLKKQREYYELDSRSG